MNLVQEYSNIITSAFELTFVPERRSQWKYFKNIFIINHFLLQRNIKTYLISEHFEECKIWCFHGGDYE
jgi:hypothetical protein